MLAALHLVKHLKVKYLFLVELIPVVIQYLLVVVAFLQATAVLTWEQEPLLLLVQFRVERLVELQETSLVLLVSLDYLQPMVELQLTMATLTLEPVP